MKRKILSLLFVLSMLTFSLNAAVEAPVAVPGGTVADVQNARFAKAQDLIKSFTSDGSGLSYKELVSVMTELKGEKLGFKEKLGLKFFRKKFSDSLIEGNDVSNGGRSSGSKSQLTALLLCFFLGGLGIHRFYLGYTWQGVVQLLTLGGLGIWVLIDFIRIIIGDLKPKDGEYDKTL